MQSCTFAVNARGTWSAVAGGGGGDSLADLVQGLRPTALIGAAAVGGAFDREVLELLAQVGGSACAFVWRGERVEGLSACVVEGGACGGEWGFMYVRGVARVAEASARV